MNSTERLREPSTEKEETKKFKGKEVGEPAEAGRKTHNGYPTSRLKQPEALSVRGVFRDLKNEA